MLIRRELRVDFAQVFILLLLVPCEKLPEAEIVCAGVAARSFNTAR